MKNIPIRNAAFALLVALAAATMLSCGNSDITQYQGHYLPAAGSQGPANGTIKVTFYGTTMLLFDDGQTQFLIDGFITRPSLGALALPLRTDQAAVDAALPQSGLHPEAIFTAHSHYDHALDVAYIAQKTGARLFGSESTLKIGRGGGLLPNKLALYQPRVEFPCGQFRITILPSTHVPPVFGIPDDIGEDIAEDLVQPAPLDDYKEGGSFDILIKHGTHSILVKPSANYKSGELDNVQADVLFLGTGMLGRQDAAFRTTYYDQTVAKVHPRLVIPIHWDRPTTPLSDHLEAADYTSTSFDFLIGRLQTDNIRFGIMQGYQSVILFDQIP